MLNCFFGGKGDSTRFNAYLLMVIKDISHDQLAQVLFCNSLKGQYVLELSEIREGIDFWPNVTHFLLGISKLLTLLNTRRWT
jgi:hypothetical protein